MRELSDDTLLRLAEFQALHRIEGWNGRPHAAVAPAATAADRVSAAVRRRRNCARLHRQWRRRLHFRCLERRAGVVPDHLFELQAGAAADGEILAGTAGAIDGSAGERESGRAEIRALPARLHVARYPPAHRRTEPSLRKPRSRPRSRRSAMRTSPARSKAGTGFVFTRIPRPNPRRGSSSYNPHMRCVAGPSRIPTASSAHHADQICKEAIVMMAIPVQASKDFRHDHADARPQPLRTEFLSTAGARPRPANCTGPPPAGDQTAVLVRVCGVDAGRCRGRHHRAQDRNRILLRFNYH